MNSERRMYGDLSWVWPIISPPEDYAEESSQFRSAIEKRSAIPVRNILNIGCGGGHIDFHLKNHYDVTGIDISPGMLENARKLNPEVKYLEGDMRSVRLHKQFDSVIIADSILYMLTEDELLAAFKTAYLHLRPGGVFCTYAEELAEKFGRFTHTHETRTAGEIDITLVEYGWDPDPGDTEIEFLFIYIIRDCDGVRVETDQHICGLFPLKAWKRLLKQAGFSAIPSKGHTGETFFTCLK